MQRSQQHNVEGEGNSKDDDMEEGVTKAESEGKAMSEDELEPKAEGKGETPVKFK